MARRALCPDLIHAAAGAEPRAGAALLCDGGVIAGVVAEREVPDGYERVRLPGRAICPGGVNAHNHSFQALLRGLGDDLPFLEWREKALYRYAPRLGPTGVETGALFAFAEMLLSGTTTVCDFFYLNDNGNTQARAVIGAARTLGMRVVMARCFYDWEGAPTLFRESPGDAQRRFAELHAELRGDALAQALPAPHSLHGASAEMIRAGVAAAEAAGTAFHIHIAEERYQVDDALAKYGKTPLRALDALGALGPRTVIIHGCWLDEGERALLAERGARIVYCPASNMFLGDGVTDIVDLDRRGVRIGLGTDGGCSNSRHSIFDEMRSCALLQKVARTDGQAISAERCFHFGTDGGGALLDLPVGRLEAGLRADVVAVDLGDPSLWPRGQLGKNLVYALSPRAVTDVWVEGQRVVEDRALVRLPLAEIDARVAQLTREWRRE